MKMTCLSAISFSLSFSFISSPTSSQFPSPSSDQSEVRDFSTGTRKVKLTTFKEIINRADLQDSLHVLVQDADLGFSIGVNDKFCDKKDHLNNRVRTLLQASTGNLAPSKSPSH